MKGLVMGIKEKNTWKKRNGKKNLKQLLKIAARTQILRTLWTNTRKLTEKISGIMCTSWTLRKDVKDAYIFKSPECILVMSVPEESF